MPRKKETPAAKKPKPAFQLSPAQKEQIGGIALMALGVVTLLLLLPGNQSFAAETYLRAIRLLVGWGVILAPLWFVAAGLYMLLDSLDKRPEIGLERPVGAVLLYVVALAFIHLFALNFSPAIDPSELATSGGGLLGQTVGDALRAAVGNAGAYVVLLAFAMAGTILLLNLSLGQIAQGFSYLFARGRGRPMLPGVRINTPTSRAPPFGPSLPSKSAVQNGKLGKDKVETPLAQPAQKEKRTAFVIGRAEAPQPPLLPLTPRIIGRDWTPPNFDTILEANTDQELSQAEIRDRVKIIEQTLAHFGVPARVVEVSQGPTVTQFGVEPGFVDRKGIDGQSKQVKVKVAAIAGLANDLALALAAAPIRIEAPIPGRAMVGIEVPNSQMAMVSLRSVVESEAYTNMESRLKLALGQDVAGQPIVADLGIMPHLLIAGATGSGKSVCINSVIACLLMNNTPQDLSLMMVDPKMVELVTYNGVPHLAMPVITDVDRVVNALQWAVSEMERRYRLFAKAGVRNLDGYNVYMSERNEPKVPYLVIIIDELADLMLSHGEEVERMICRLAQMSRATGIHLIIATQRPSVDVVTGLIKANFPARIAFAVTTQVDSRVILDSVGAEKLLGRGDMLYMASDSSKLVRLQGCYVSDEELRRLVHYWRAAAAPEGSPPDTDFGSSSSATTSAPLVKQQPLWEEVIVKQKQAEGQDELLDKAIEVVQAHDRASVSLLQRRLRIGYSRAARLIDLMEERGIVGPPEEAGRWRKVLQKGEMPTTSGAEREWEEEEEGD